MTWRRAKIYCSRTSGPLAVEWPRFVLVLANVRAALRLQPADSRSLLTLYLGGLWKVQIVKTKGETRILLCSWPSKAIVHKN
jgi:hypothetical protein